MVKPTDWLRINEVLIFKKKIRLKSVGENEPRTTVLKKL